MAYQRLDFTRKSVFSLPNTASTDTSYPPVGYVEVILFYNGLDVPTRQILDSKGAIPTITAANAKIAIQEMAEYSQKWHNGTSSKAKSTKTSDRLATIQAQHNCNTLKSEYATEC
ncbi:hypothetical protein Tco_0569111 [Tanacetum coccineum]